MLESGSGTVHKDLAFPAGHRPYETRSEHDLAETFALLANGNDVAPTEPQTAPPAPKPERKSRRRHLALDVSIVVGVVVVYVLSLLGYHWPATSPGPLPEPDVSTADTFPDASEENDNGR